MPRISQIDMLDADNPQPLPDETVIRYTLAHGWIEVRHKGEHIEVTSRGRDSTIRLLVQPWVSNQLFLSLEPL